MLSGCYGGSRPPHIGTAAPGFTVQDSDRKVSLDELRGKVVVLNFWATWCPPCIEEMPSLVQMQQKMKGKGVEVLAISVDADLMDETGRAAILDFFSEIFGWTEGDNSTEKGNPLILYTGSLGQFLYLLPAKDQSSLR